jgi:hypothetical protein
VIFIAIAAPILAPYDPIQLDARNALRSPDSEYWLGTDQFGRDILSRLLFAGRVSLIVGFAAETDLEEEHGREKLHRKGLDLIVVNRVDMADSGFGVDTNRAVLLGADGSRVEVPLTTKAELAQVIWDRVVDLLSPADAGLRSQVT